MSEKDFIERQLIKLNRKYGKDELVQTLKSKLSEKEIQIGILKDEIQYYKEELEKLKRFKHLDEQTLKETKKEHLYNQQKQVNKALQKKLSLAKATQKELAIRLSKLENK